MSDFCNEKNSGFKNPLNPKARFKWGFMDIIPATAPTSLTSDATFSGYFLIVDAYSNIQNFMVRIRLPQKK